MKIKFKSGSLLFVVGFSLLTWTACSFAKTTQPNIIYILVDDLGYGDLSSFGGVDIKTPAIDSIAERGMRFTDFYANSTVCSPTRASLLTGQYPDRVGVPGVIRPVDWDSFGYLSSDAVLLPEQLRKAGYDTALVGKWHLGLESPNLPGDRGFDLFRGHLSGMMDYYTHRQNRNHFLRHNEREVEAKGHATDVFTGWALDYIRQRESNEKPFFLYLAYTAPHDPVQPPESWLNKVLQREKGIESKRANLVALIEHLDDGIGQVLKAVKEQGMLEDTLIVFSSDNGGALQFGASNKPLRGGKADMYEGGIKVPAAAMWKGRIAQGTETHQRVMTMDWFPTLSQIAGVEVKHAIDGESISPLLMGRDQDLNGRTLFWVRRDGGSLMSLAYYAARYQKFKVVQNRPFEALQFFDLEQDPEEKQPLSIESDVNFKVLKDKLRSHIQRAGQVPWQKGRP